MSVKLKVEQHTIRIGRKFVTGRDAISIDGIEVYSGPIRNGSPYSFVAAHRRILVTRIPTSLLMGVHAYRIQVLDGSDQVFSGLFDHRGKARKSMKGVRATLAIQVCGSIGAMLGIVTFAYLRAIDAPLPGREIAIAMGGALGTTLGGGVDGGLCALIGGVVGWINGSLIFRR